MKANGPEVGGGKCLTCGARLRSDGNTCWLCSEPLQPLRAVNPYAPHPMANMTTTPSDRWLGGGDHWPLIITTVVILLGLFLIAPGLGILAAILFAPPRLRTARIVQQKVSPGAQVSLGGRIGVFLTSFMVVIFIVVVSFAAAVGTFCFICIRAIRIPGLGEVFVIAASGLEALAVLFGVGFVMRRSLSKEFD